MSNAVFSPVLRPWIESVCTGLGLSESDVRRCVDSQVLMLGDVPVAFGLPAAAKDSQLIVQAVIGQVPPPGRCEAVYELVLGAQMMMCGPIMPVIALELTTRNLLLTYTVDTAEVGAEDGTLILRSMQGMVHQWREALKDFDKLTRPPRAS